MPHSIFCRRFRTRGFLWQLTKTAYSPTRSPGTAVANSQLLQFLDIINLVSTSPWKAVSTGTIQTSQRPLSCAPAQEFDLAPRQQGSEGQLHQQPWRHLGCLVQALSCHTCQLSFSWHPHPKPNPASGLRFVGGEGRSHLAKEQPLLHFGSPLPAHSPARTGFCFLGSQTQWKLSWFLRVQDLNVVSSRYRRISLQTRGNTWSRVILTFWPSEGSSTLPKPP